MFLGSGPSLLRPTDLRLGVLALGESGRQSALKPAPDRPESGRDSVYAEQYRPQASHQDRILRQCGWAFSALAFVELSLERADRTLRPAQRTCIEGKVVPPGGSAPFAT
jgi:hypothetical protein